MLNDVNVPVLLSLFEYEIAGFMENTQNLYFDSFKICIVQYSMVRNSGYWQPKNTPSIEETDTIIVFT